jgi:hypothetical protein
MTIDDLPDFMRPPTDPQESDQPEQPSPDQSRAARQVRHELLAPKGSGNRTALIELEKQTFEIAFEFALEHLADGCSLSEFCHGYHTPISTSRFRTWMFRDPRRKEAYHAAKALGAETVEDDLIRISDGLRPDLTPTPEETARAKLRIDTRKWLLQVWNRKRYGDVKHIEQNTTTTIDVSTMSKHDLEQQLMRSLGIGETFDHGLFDAEEDTSPDAD